MAARLEPLYHAVFTTPEAWSVNLGTEGQSFLIAEGRTEGGLSARLRAANYPRRRADGVLTPDFRGVLETDDGATVLFTWHGFARPEGENGAHQLVGALTHLSNDARYSHLNDTLCTLTGEVRPRVGGAGFDVVVEVEQLVWERPTASNADSRRAQSAARNCATASG
jgi:hypothetical protein